MHHPYPTVPTQMTQYMPSPECSWRDYCPEQPPLPELSFAQCPCPPRSLAWQSPSMENGYQLRASIYSYGPTDSQPSPFPLDASIRSAEALSDFRLHVSIYVRDTLVREVTTSSPEGCHITPSPQEKSYMSAGGPDVVALPVDTLSAQRRADECPPSPPSGLESGVLLWMGADGLYARRLCQSRVEPLFARQFLYYAQQTGGHYYRGYEHPAVTEHIPANEDYPRAVTHHHSSSLQE
ncbi:hypothetical protein XENOCAPTIV_017052 [Xenoophorus captivus]|uniref:Interferon regulatory factor-3 domain-containing protein n=1 Tax=Xenoophorus captivus TaxID=1517983 RepID=A0ABV0QSB8_9TELE